MCDEETFTERARGWIKEFEPTPEQIQSAYTNMLAKLAKNPELVNEDTDECVELLIKAYQHSGGSVDDLFSAVEAAKAQGVAGAGSAVVADPDYGALYEVGNGPTVTLAPEEKKAAFQALKAQLQGKPAPF